jgi:hypothetical protein
LLHLEGSTERYIILGRLRNVDVHGRYMVDTA